MEPYLGHYQIFMMKLFTKMVTDWKTLIIFAKNFITDVWEGPK